MDRPWGHLFPANFIFSCCLYLDSLLSQFLCLTSLLLIPCAGVGDGTCAGVHVNFVCPWGILAVGGTVGVLGFLCMEQFWSL